jgi:hypothetical protein
MITKETLEAVNNGILTDDQLNEAIQHYTELEKNLKCHGEAYHLVWKDAFFTLTILEGFREARKKG